MKEIIDYFKIIGVDANTTATIFITLFTFSIGLFLAWSAKQLKNIKEKKSYRKSLVLILTDFAKSCEKQNNVVLNSIANIDLNKGKAIFVKYVPIGTLDYLNQLDFNIFLQNFEPFIYKRNFSKAISKLFELIAQINVQNKTINEFLKYYSDKYTFYESLYLNNIDALRKTHDELMVMFLKDTMSNRQIDVVIQEYFNLFENWTKNGADRELSVTRAEIVLKVLALCKSNPSSSIILQINNSALECDYAFENMVKMNELLDYKFKSFAHFHRRASKVTTLILKIIK